MIKTMCTLKKKVFTNKIKIITVHVCIVSHFYEII